MSRVCSVCAKAQQSHNMVTHSHRKSIRTCGANVHKVKVVNKNGTVSSEYVCTRCLRSGKVERA